MKRNYSLYLLFFIFIISTTVLIAKLNSQEFQKQKHNLHTNLKFIEKAEHLSFPKRLCGASKKKEFNRHENGQSFSRDPIDVKVNGEDQGIIVQGDDLIVTVNFFG
jgi:hypothetical protein